MKPKNNLIGSSLVVPFIVAALALLMVGCSRPAEKESLPGITVAATAQGTPIPSPQVIPTLEVGQSAQLPGLLVTLRRAAWKDRVLATYWVLQNSGAKKIGELDFYGTLVLEARDDAGNIGDSYFSFTQPEWAQDEVAAKKLSSLDTIWPGETVVHSEEWEFGPLSKGVQVAVKFSPFVSYDEPTRTYVVKWRAPAR